MKIINKIELTNDNAIEILKMYSDEWEYLTTQYWDILIKLSIVNYLVILFPFVYDILKVDVNKLNLPLIIFPVLGVVLSFLFLFINISLSARKKTLHETMERIISNFSIDYCKKLNFNQIDLKFKKLVSLRTSAVVSWGNFIIQIVLSVVVIVLLFRK